ncbi:F0F1 ATP synthase subunit B [Aldersonia kunmingensis]|uniref:F0F1 ATP synthase subunit B n=1 Tax=Aldersonia kunmingensis TaxID=408066 RepID=UPI00083694D8|nr:F0F1 ATP synthase subunit B [Aldersonia kunmingensis]
MDSALLLAAEEGETTNFLIPNGTFFVELIIFLIVLGVIVKFVVPPISKVLSEREELLAKTAEDNHQAARELADADAAYKEELGGARAEASRIREEGRAEGQAVLDEMRDQAKQESDAIAQRASAELQEQGRQIAQELQGRVGPLSETLANRVLGVEGASASTNLADHSGRG